MAEVYCVYMVQGLVNKHIVKRLQWDWQTHTVSVSLAFVQAEIKGFTLNNMHSNIFPKTSGVPVQTQFANAARQPNIAYANAVGKCISL